MANPQSVLSHKIDAKASSYIKYLLGLSYVDRIIDFLDPTNGSTNYLQLSEFFSNGILPFGESLDGSPLDAINYNEEDQFSLYAINLGINYWLNGSTQAIKSLSRELINTYNSQTGNNYSEFEIKVVFFDGWPSPTKPNGTPEPNHPAVNIAAYALYHRLLIWKNLSPALDVKLLVREEIKFILQEIDKSIDPDGKGESSYLETVLQAVYKEDDIEYYLNILKTQSRPSEDVGSISWLGFYRAFDPEQVKTKPTIDPKGLSADQFDKLIDKIIQSGLLQLASYATDIGIFARQRLSDGTSVQQSAANALDPVRDTAWLNQLIYVTTNLTRDPIALQTINVYFPALVTFFFDALAATADYSNNGKGGGEEDELNDINKFLEEFQKALGMRDGESVFELASNFQERIGTTSKKIAEVLTNSPYRPNSSPETPDIFHLRLGAANFYVPPLSININAAFKTGSLTGGALRQRNTPKFNSGYKETSITMRLFFPNYEEIWGISIEDASRIRLKDNFVIDFSSDGDSDKKIDKFLSSLRGIIAAFKYSPFLPIKNSYLNGVHGITAVALSGMQIQTVPNFPFALAVDLELLNFNHKPLLPMISDFNQAIHWGKYRQYMGKAAGAMYSYVNGDFLQKKSDVKASDKIANSSNVQSGLTVGSNTYDVSPYGASLVRTSSYDDEKLTTNILDEWNNGNNITFYIPIESQTKIFLPDTSSFRADNEDLITDQGEDFWSRILSYVGIDINQSADYGITLANTYQLATSGQYNRSIKNILRDAIDVLTAGVSTGEPQKKVYDYLVKVFLIENKSLSDSEKTFIKDINSMTVPGQFGTNNYIVNGEVLRDTTISVVKDYMKKISLNSKTYLDQTTESLAVKKAKSQGIEIPGDGQNGNEEYQNIYNETKAQVSDAFSVLLYERFYTSGPIQALMEAARARAGAFQFREWEVPMMKVDLDPSSVIVNGVSVSLGNNLAKLQLQMQDEPTYQHIGGRDTFINISMTVTGEKELAKIKRIFDHVNSLARLEHASGVLGFMGIKNIITALAGVKYVMPSNYSVSTMPDYPHVYQVSLSLMDFDVFQQTREKLSSKQQADFIDIFNTKRNPFLRIKQLWGSFNAYPDLPLQIKDPKTNETVGTLDPDFYFRSFEMFDRDVINNVSSQTRYPAFNSIGPTFDGKVNGTQQEKMQKQLAVIYLLQNFIREFGDLTTPDLKSAKLKELILWINGNEIDHDLFLATLKFYIEKNENIKVTGEALLTDYINFNTGTVTDDPDDNLYNADIHSQPYVVGDVSSSSRKLFNIIEMALSGSFSLKDEDNISFMPDDLEFHGIIHQMPILDPAEPNKIPATFTTAYGVNFGYIDVEKDGRFYLTIDGVNIKKGSKVVELAPVPIEEHTNPANGTNSSAIASLSPLSSYSNPVSHGDSNGPEWSSQSDQPPKSVNMHWEKMLVDTQYRDISGRMLRAFPTYMLWLIDEGGYFAGVKLFDNFYGLQSIIDFSVVSSEDLLGDTLIFRVSNLYSKLTKPAATDIFGPDSALANSALGEDLAGILGNTLNKARNIAAHMKGEYVVDIESIVLKPGVRVHLRGGYGSNPNSLQTLFNGTITQVEYGEIVTVTAQSDAIELGAVVNSTNKKGDSGKIDGGINTGLWMSEPRDLMVRLLSMGTSRFREGIANANRGLVFSENKFGIRHFGSMLYEPMTAAEAKKHFARVDAIADAHKAVSELTVSGMANSGLNMLGMAGVGVQEFRGGVSSLMTQLWSNFSSQRDLEIFKRNIYPGNGTGIAQFLGGDLGDGWTSVASITPENQPNPRLDYLSRLSDASWNKLVQGYDSGSASASQVVESITESGTVRTQEGSANLFKNLTLGGIGAGMLLAGGPVTASVGVGIGLLGVLSGRGGTNIFRSLGLISSNPDDDMRGFDEVSFRAQTYMRTVWELFQTCARLLPNYIVAVRPFEDRSTVFYGKPHWLYTSGVIPITTGYPGDERAAELGIIPPQINQPDFDLLQIVNSINKEITPYADAEAFLRGTEPLEAFNVLAEQQAKSLGIFQTAGFLGNEGIVLNFNSENAKQIKDDKGNIIAKLPTNKGNVTVGFHLPVVPKGNAPVQLVSDFTGKNHAQINQLPSRFRFPFFTARKDDEMFLDTYAFQYGNLKGVGTATSDAANNTDSFLLNTSQKLYGEEFKKLLQYDIDYQAGQNISGTLAYDILSNPLDFSLSGSFEVVVNATTISVTMPLPELNRKDNLGSDLIELDPKLDKTKTLSYSEWTPPHTDIDEQFYIAMRWPYQVGLQDAELLKKFKQFYFDNDKEELYGKVEDYRNQHVLIYNPSAPGGGAAVVCKPAYFLWGKNDGYEAGHKDKFIPQYDEAKVDAVVSPDAAYYLNILTTKEYSLEQDKAKKSGYNYGDEGYSAIPDIEECHFAFVPNTVPLGVAFSSVHPIKQFKLIKGQELPSPVGPGSDGLQPFNPEGDPTTRYPKPETNDDLIIGFGNFTPPKNYDELYAVLVSLNAASIYQYKPIDEVGINATADYLHGGNYSGYYSAIRNKEYTNLDNWEYQYDLLMSEDPNQDYDSAGRSKFPGVYNPQDSVSIQARKFYDEDFDPTTNVIAGNGRTLSQAQQIWDQFRFGYHTYDSVKEIFFNTFLLDADDTTGFPDEIKKIFSSEPVQAGPYKKFGDSNGNALDEFSILFGDTITKGNTSTINAQKEAIEYARKNFIDAPAQDGGLIEYFNALTIEKIKLLKANLFDLNVANNIFGTTMDDTTFQATIDSPAALFYYLVGLFRQTLWADPYARAWLVLKPDKKIIYGHEAKEDKWSFKPIDKIFEAFIFPGNTYAKKKDQFLQLLYKNKGEGNSATNLASKTLNSLGDFYDKSIGQIFNAVTDSLSALFNVFRLNMLQTGYGLSQSSVLAKQANILNKALNDSIYYSLGRPGSLLRAVDNPFTREYAEPVVEVREPFQRVHYLSSFSHILSNQIQENSGVATTITAVSDGKYPVTVSLDKGAPADRQVESTVETGIYFDNVVGSGFFGFLHPILHPFETGRGFSKNVTGAPDELSAKRIALSHLRESVKDIYSGEIIIIGNADIRPHDLIYLADIYERMYGMFEVEQVVHHFTPELGFVTSITPNALVTINDPAKWFMSSWIHSWLSIQTMRNDTRIYLDSLRAGNSGITVGGEISIDALSNSLSPQMLGGMQFTGGSSALIKDIVANATASGFGNANTGDAIREYAKAQAGINGNNGQVTGSTIAGVISGVAGISIAAGSAGSAVASGAAAVAAGTVSGIGAGVGIATVGILAGPLLWKGWKWVRDNLMDQHGCYVQYLTRNGQPMEAGLAYNQGMVVGRYHSKALLPGILGVRVKARTADGYSYIRTNDLMKSLGWNEKEISTLTRYIGYENALVHAKVLELGGLGPDKTTFDPFFKVLCALDSNSASGGVRDGDTIDVYDILNPNVKFTVRLDGINVSEKVQIGFQSTSKTGNVIGKNIRKVGDKYYATLVTGGISYTDQEEIIRDQNGYPVYTAKNNMLIPVTIKEGLYLTRDKVTISNLGAPFDSVRDEQGNYTEFDVLPSQIIDPDFDPSVLNYFTYELPATAAQYYDADLQNEVTPISNKDVFEKEPKYSSVEIPQDLIFEDFGTPGLMATQFVKKSLSNKTFVVRIKQSRVNNQTKDEAEFEPTGKDKRIEFLQDRYQRTLGTIFYNFGSDSLDKIKNKVFSFMEKYDFVLDDIKEKFMSQMFYDRGNVFVSNFNQIFDSIGAMPIKDHSAGYTPLLEKLPELPNASEVTLFFSIFVEMSKLEQLYNNSSRWPLVLWDEYYEDGTPATLNWELITKNYGTTVYTKDLLTESESVLTSKETSATLQNKKTTP
jgi:hypothetical protein